MKGSHHTLRLVTSDDVSSRAPAEASFHSDWDSLCESFKGATGADLAFRSPDDPDFPKTPVWESDVPAAGPYAPGTLGLLKPDRKVANLGSIKSLAEHVGKLATQLHESHRALWQRNAELATAVPMVVDTAEENSALAKRFQALLQSAARAAGADQAAMFVLDDNTQFLQLRAHHGLDHSLFTSPPTELRQSNADIEALAGHAIVLEDTSESFFQLPEIVTESGLNPGAAICVPISTATIPLGTLWIFANDPTEFDDVKVDMIEIIAGRLAAEMEREILLREQAALGNSGRVNEAIEWQRDRLQTNGQTIDSENDRWQLAGKPGSTSRLHGDFYDWRLNHSNRLGMILASSHHCGMPAALSAARMSGLAVGLELANPAKCIAEISQRLWEGSAGDDQASLFVADLNQETGELTFCAAGMVDAFVIRPHGWEPIIQLNNTPVGQLDRDPGTSLWESSRATLHPGDILLVLSGKPRLRARKQDDGQVDGPHFAEAALHHNHLDPNALTMLLSGLWDHQTSPWSTPPAQLIARRLP